MKTIPMPSLDFLHECFEVDEMSPSLLIWKKRPQHHFKLKRDCNAWNCQYSGKIAGGLKDKGYYYIRIGSLSIPAHRIVFYLFNPEIDIQDFMVDHKDGNPANNFPDNLRKATAVQNSNNSKHLGIRQTWNQWEARIYNGEKRVSLGLFETKNAAIQAYQEAKNNLHKEFSPFFSTE